MIHHNKQFGATVRYAYDKGGNITKSDKYPYTLVENLDCLESETVLYEYSSSGWRDQLNSYNGESCVYDALGNPTKYRGVGAIWEHGKRLRAIGNVSFSYNASGQRLSKKTPTGATRYMLSSDRVVGESNGKDMLTYHYGAEGVIGLTYNGEEYYYRKNIQGDISAIYKTESNELVAEYHYNAWGEIKVVGYENGEAIDITSADKKLPGPTCTAEELQYINTQIAIKNPFRYRGYYYDRETGLYHCGSRYYDPQVGRWLNADDISYLDPETIGGLNLYSYCGNNPVMNIDPNGYAFFSILLMGFLIGGAISATIGGVTAAAQGKTGWELFGAIAGGFVLGGALGAATFLGGALGAGVLAATAGNILGGLAVASIGAFGVGMLSYGIKEVWTVEGASWDWGTALAYGGIAAVQGLVSFGIGAAMGGAGMWKSMSPGNGFGAVVKGSVQNAVGQAGKMGFKTVMSGAVRGAMTYFQQNAGWMIGRAVYKSFFVQPWGFIRLAL